MSVFLCGMQHNLPGAAARHGHQAQHHQAASALNRGECCGQDLTGLAGEVGVSEATIRRIFHDYFTERLKHYHPEAPR
jgi:hypothetical protein